MAQKYGEYTLEKMRLPLATYTAIKSTNEVQNTQLVLHIGSIMVALAFFCGGPEPFKKVTKINSGATLALSSNVKMMFIVIRHCYGSKCS